MGTNGPTSIWVHQGNSSEDIHQTIWYSAVYPRKELCGLSGVCVEGGAGSGKVAGVGRNENAG